MRDISKQAIEAALSCNWQEAIKLNKEILKKDSQNIDTLNRLGRAYFELGNISQAKKYYSQTLNFDAYNPIAQKNLKIIKAFKKPNVPRKPQPPSLISPTLFLQEPGKTRVVSLLKVAEPSKLSQIYCGMEITLFLKQRGITATLLDGNYLGVLPDDLAHHLIRFMRGGNKYSAHVKSVRVNGVSLLIREVKRSQRFKNQPTFLDSQNFNLGNQSFSSNLKRKETPIFEEE